MERINYFKNYNKYAKEIKKFLSKHFENFEMYVFGSVVIGEYSIGLSDIDIAIVSDEFKKRDRKLMIYDLLFEKYFNFPSEFHLLTKKQWSFFKKFIKKFVKV